MTKLSTRVVLNSLAPMSLVKSPKAALNVVSDMVSKEISELTNANLRKQARRNYDVKNISNQLVLQTQSPKTSTFAGNQIAAKAVESMLAAELTKMFNRSNKLRQEAVAKPAAAPTLPRKAM